MLIEPQRIQGAQEKAMKAIVQEEYGSLDALQLREVEKPAPGDDEVLVRVRAASVHPDVWHVVCGRPYVLRLMGSGCSRPKNHPFSDCKRALTPEGSYVLIGHEKFGESGKPVFGPTLSMNSGRGVARTSGRNSAASTCAAATARECVSWFASVASRLWWKSMRRRRWLNVASASLDGSS